MTAPDLFATPEGRCLRASRSGENCGSRSAQKASRIGTISLRSLSVLLQPVGDPGGACNASPGSNHHRLVWSAAMAFQTYSRLGFRRHGAA